MSDPKIRIRRSSTPNKVPTITQLELGELAINTYDGKLYLEQDQGAAGVGNTVVRVNPWNVGLGTTAYNISFTSGKVGIGTTVAQYNLDVGGDINFTGNLTQDGNAFTSGVTVKDEGSALSTQATTLNFVGNGVVATGNGAEKTITITSGTGAQGAAGAQGATGSTGAQGATAAAGAQGAQGAQGASGGGGGGGGASVSVGSNPPGSPSGGDLWWDSDVGELYIYYSDTDSNQWVETSGGSETVTVSDNAPSSPNHGDLWWESDTGQLKIYYNDGDSAQWVDANAGVLSSLTVWQSNSTGINTTSHVGIGTTTADAALTVDGNVSVSGVSTFADDITVQKHLKFGDSPTGTENLISFGAGGDLNIFHSGNGSFIRESGTGPLTIMTSKLHIRNSGNNEEGIIFSENSSVELYHNNVKRLETSSVGVSIPQDLDVDGHTNLDNVSVAGVSTFSDNVRIVDNKSLLIGDHTNGDLSFVHDGNNSVIRNRTGDLYFANATQTGILLGGSTGLVRLYHGGDLKLETETEGVKVTGRLRTTGDLDVDGHTNLDNVSISGVTTMTGMLRIDSGNLQVYGTAPNIFLRDTDNNPDYRFMNSHGSVKIFDETNGLDRFIINPAGKVSVLYDLDVDGHTNLDNVSIAGVTTVTGDVNVGTSQASGVILTSPNGTRYRLVVANDGTLSTTAA